MQRPELVSSALGDSDPASAQIGTREVLVESRNAFVESPIYDFAKLLPGNSVVGPAVIHTPVTTIVLQDAQTGRIDEYMNTVIEFE
jgi:N-methylhydantoinase A